MLDGSAVTADQVVSRADIDADELVYMPPCERQRLSTTPVSASHVSDEQR